MRVSLFAVAPLSLTSKLPTKPLIDSTSVFSETRALLVLSRLSFRSSASAACAMLGYKYLRFGSASRPPSLDPRSTMVTGNP
jgi:hypothetical protein